MVVQTLLQGESKNRVADEKAAIQHGEVIRTGTHKDVYIGLRGAVKPVEEDDFEEENHERLTGTELTADAEINLRDFTDIGLWPDTVVIKQQMADRELEEAVQHYRTGHVVEETVENLLDEFTERGLVYSDPGDNIGFFSGKAKAFDVYDESSFDLYQSRPEEMSQADFHSFSKKAPVMYQKFACDLARYAPEETEEVVDKVSEASDYLISGEASITDFQQAFEYRR
ncbi:MAG: hypothetical protein ABEJ87_00700 [Candidatus Nanohalobium sp.]